MSKQVRICVILLYLNLLSAASISMNILSSSTNNPATLLLPSGFDSQLPPRQPMLYPFVASMSAESKRASLKNLPIITPGWIPMSSQAQGVSPLIPTLYASTSTSAPLTSPVVEDRISQYEAPPLLSSSNDGPVFESIVYGTWKPDPPLQPAEVLSEKQQQQQQQPYSGVTSNSGIVIDGKVYNKTINRQHGGFIGHIQHKPIKDDKQNVLRNNNENASSSSTPSSIEYRTSESTELSSEQKKGKHKKQGRLKIRTNTTTTQQLTTVSETTARTEQTTKSKQSVIRVSTGDPQLMEVVKQFNDSIEIKYNHKQSSTHSIEMTMTTNDNDDNDANDEQRHTHTHSLASATVTTTSSELQQTEDDLENASATRRNWPADFMSTPLSSTSATNSAQSQETDSTVTSSSASIEADSSELPLALSALNIPPSLWPKLPGNISKFGLPYEAENSAEEPALCVPITVREPNMMNSNEIVFIERVFCFPMPITTIRDTTSSQDLNRVSTTRSTVTKAKVQNYEDFLDINMGNTACPMKRPFYLLTYLVVIYIRFVY